MNIFKIALLFSALFLGVAQADSVSDWCHERNKLADYRGEASQDCVISEENARSDLWSLQTLNWGIQVRLDYADRHGIYYDTNTITSHVRNNFVMGNEQPWITETYRLMGL